MLLRVGAIHAVSWMWASDVPSVTHAAANGKNKTKGDCHPTDIEVANLNLEEKDWKAQGVLGCPVGVLLMLMI